jgi:uncharacterized ion transporter superfamily protein YfcC
MNKQKRSVNSIALLMILLAIIAVCTHLIPSGAYERIEVAGRMVVDPATFTFIENKGASVFDFFLAIPKGMTNAISLIIAFMFINGAMEVIQKTGAINVGVTRVIKLIGVERGDIVLVVMFYLFAFLGGFLGMVEGSLPFFPIAISIALALGYDGIVGVAISMVGACSGFLCGPVNPSSVAISQTIAGLELYSGMGLRLVMFAVVPLFCLAYIMWYAKRVKKDPSKSYMAGTDVSDISFDLEEFQTYPFTKVHAAVLLTLAAGLIAFIYGASTLGWGFDHISAIFIIVSLITAIIGRIPVNDAVNAFTKGCAAMMGGTILLGVAYGIAWILNQASVLDTIVYFISRPLQGQPVLVSIIGVLIAVMLINLLIPSGSAKAAIVMPIIIPIAEIVGLTAQTAVLAYQLGDGITNMCGPLYGTLLLVCSMGKVPFSKWEKFVLPMLAGLSVIAAVFLFIAIQIGYC